MVKLENSIEGEFINTENKLYSEILDLESSAWETGFYQVAPKKITASSLFESFWMMKQLGKNTLSNWSNQLGLLEEKTITPQSLNERINTQSVQLAEVALKKALAYSFNTSKIREQKNEVGELLGLFNRIMIRDSTTQQLPYHLSKFFPGSHSHGKPTAIMRIQSLFNFSEEKWEDFQISAYTDNDQKAAKCIADFLQPRDLILQDLGYFTLEWIDQVIENQFLITKWNNLTTLLTTTGKKINLLQLLKGKTQIDMPVLLGIKKQIPMRMVIRKLPKAQAKERIKKAKKDRHSKANHSKEYFKLLRYEIYLTNISCEHLKAKAIAKLYGLRWYIEILFKSWKSYLNFKKIFQKEKMKLDRVRFCIYAILIEVVFLTHVIYHKVKQELRRTKNQHLSILKFMDTANDLLFHILKIKHLRELIPLIPLFSKNATYKKHPNRVNTLSKYLYVKQLCIKVS